LPSPSCIGRGTLPSPSCIGHGTMPSPIASGLASAKLSVHEAWRTAKPITSGSGAVCSRLDTLPSPVHLY